MRFFVCGALLLSLLLSGCCANNACDCQDLLEDALFFQFDSGFTAADIDTVYLGRYSRTYGTTPLTQATLVRTTRLPYAVHRKLVAAGLDTANTIVLANNYPFTPGSTGGKINQYTYLLQVREGDRSFDEAGNPRKVYTYSIGQIQLTGRYVGDGCCTCYQNAHKAVQVADTVHNVTEQGSQPVPIVLHKYP